METKKIQLLLQQYFEGETSFEEESILEEYFSSDDIAEELLEYKEFFSGISEIRQLEGTSIEEDIMDFILEKEHQEKTRYRGLWKTVTGIAASIIIVLGSLLIYEQQKQPFKDTFTNPDEAYAYAEKTLQYISGVYETGLSPLSKSKKINDGLAELEKFNVLNEASKPIKKGIKTINKGFDITENLQKNSQLTKNE
ncbi:MAG: hypothetical protein JW833_03720 [Prolixibacteraceae bacterium]|nr:hypothetical protein [Prolixibacteraceae bacterium]